MQNDTLKYAVGYIGTAGNKEYCFGEYAKVYQLIVPRQAAVKNIWTETVTLDIYDNHQDMLDYINLKKRVFSGCKISFNEIT